MYLCLARFKVLDRTLFSVQHSLLTKSFIISMIFIRFSLKYNKVYQFKIRKFYCFWRMVGLDRSICCLFLRRRGTSCLRSIFYSFGKIWIKVKNPIFYNLKVTLFPFGKKLRTNVIAYILYNLKSIYPTITSMSGSKRMTRHALFPPKEIKTFIAKLPNRPQSPLTPSDTVSLVKNSQTNARHQNEYLCFFNFYVDFV